MVFLILYVGDILLIGNDFEMLSMVKIQLATQFQMKDLGEAQYVLSIKIIRERKKIVKDYMRWVSASCDRFPPG